MVEKIRTDSQAHDTKKTAVFTRRAQPAAAPRVSHFSDNFQHLQRSLGNQAVWRLFDSTYLQAKLQVSQPDDLYEQEAARIADQVMRMPNRGGQSKPLEITPLVQRQPEKDEEEKNLETKNLSGQGSSITPQLEETIHSLKGGGLPLDPATRAFFEPRFGYDFSQVRLHTDANAEKSAQDLNAHAYTVGHDIVFGEDKLELAPGTDAGQRLLAHELAHVVQQGGSSPGQIQRQVEVRLQPAITGKVPVGQVSREEFERAEKKNACRVLIDDLQHSIEEKKLAWDIAFRNLGSAYYTAYHRHKTAIEQAAKEEAIQEAIAFGILTAITVGVLGWVGEAVKAGKFANNLKKFMIGGLEDAIQSGIGEGIDVIQMIVIPTGVLVSQDPYLFQNDLLNANDDQLRKVKQFFNGLRACLEKRYNQKPEELDKIDLIKAKENISKELKDNQMMKEPEIHKQDEVADELERGFWKEWLPRLEGIRFSPEFPKTGVLGEYKVWSKPGRKVEERLDKLGITKMALHKETIGWLWTFEYEIAKLIDWSRSFEPKKFKF